MKAARFHGRRDVRIDDIPEPTLRPGAVAIDVAWCGICGTDLHEYLDGPIFISKKGHPHPLSHESLPVTLGHEFSGTITALGDGVTDLDVGESVVVEPYFVCGECPPCRAGNYNQCTSMGFIGLAGGGGGLSGAGPIGLLLAAVLKAQGITVIISEISEARKAKAVSTGVANYVLDSSIDDVTARVLELTNGVGADVAFECSSVNAVLHLLFEVVRPGGVIVNVSIWGQPVTVDMQKLVIKELDLRGTIAYAHDHPTVIQLVADGKIDLAPFITAKIGLDELVTKGFDALIHRKDSAVKILVRP